MRPNNQIKKVSSVSLITLVLVTLAIDLLSKYMVSFYMDVEKEIPNRFFFIHPVENTVGYGSWLRKMFDFFNLELPPASYKPFLSILGCFVFIYCIKKSSNHYEQIGWSFMISASLGNAISLIDFIYFAPIDWFLGMGIINVADFLLILGLGFVIWGRGINFRTKLQEKNN